MNRSIATVVGVVLVLMSFIIGLFLVVNIGLARADSYLGGFNTDPGYREFTEFNCPMLVSVNDVFPISASIPKLSNSSTALNIETGGFSLLSDELEVGPNSDEISMSFELQAVESGRKVVAIFFNFLEDQTQTNSFSFRETSFFGSCGIFVLNAPISGQQLLILSLCVIVLDFAVGVPLLFVGMRKKPEDIEDAGG